MSEKQINYDKKATERMNRGSAWMTLGTFTSRILGLLYIIPWVRWMGDPTTANEANALFDIGYRFYAIFLAISTAGIPSAISKQIAFYNARQQFKRGRELYRKAVLIMLAMGIICGLLLFFLAPIFAESTPVKHPHDAVLVIRSLVPALALFPLLSIFRGYFQGHQDMRPSAISQITEQFFRVAYILLMVYVIRQIQGGSIVQAVMHSTLAAFVGVVVAMLTLGVFYIKNKEDYQPYAPDLSVDDEIGSWNLFKEIMLVSIPFIVTGAGIELCHLIDTNTYMPIISRAGLLSEANAIDQYAIFSANISKLITVVVSLGLAISSTAIPVISGLYGQEADHNNSQRSLRFQGTNAVVIHNYQLFLMVLLPVCIGLALLADPVYSLVYRSDLLGTYFLRVACIIAFLQAAYAVNTAMLQAIGQHKAAIIGFLVGIGLKLVWQYPLITHFGTVGALMATIISFAVVNIFYMLAIRQKLRYDTYQLFKELKPILLAGAVMSICGLSLYFAFDWLIPVPNIYGQLVLSLLMFALCAWVYGLILLREKKLDLLLGTQAELIRHYLGIEG